jgi:EpsI family protein
MPSVRSDFVTMKSRTSIHFWILLVALLLSGGLINAWQQAGEAKVSRRALKEFPSEIGSWRQHGDDSRFDAETEKVLRADDYVARNFQLNGRIASLYVGYYATQRSGATYHSPLNCLPGAGWVMSDAGRVLIKPAGSAPFEANRYTIQNGKERALMLYWYQGRGKVVASEYWAKIYTVLDSVRQRRSDGALVRVMTPIGDSPAEAEKAAVEFASQASPALPEFVPN